MLTWSLMNRTQFARLTLERFHSTMITSYELPNRLIWLNAIPNPCTGSLLTDNFLRISDVLRLSCKRFYLHECRCCLAVNKFAIRSLSCNSNFGRFPRNSDISMTSSNGLWRVQDFHTHWKTSASVEKMANAQMVWHIPLRNMANV